MIMFVLQSALLIAIAFLLGGVVGCLLRQWVGEPVQVAGTPKLPPKPAQPEGGSGLSAAVVAERQPQAEPLPDPAKLAEAPKLKRKAGPKAKSPAAAEDDLKKIRGIGKQNEKRLNDAGIRTYAQIASWTAAEQAEWGEILAFPGRIEREDWVGQAKALAGGGAA